MTRAEITDLLATLAAIYPLDVTRATVDAWEWVLSDADRVSIAEAARQWARTKPQFAPRPAELREAAGENRNQIDPLIYGRFGALRESYQRRGCLDPDQASELHRIERLMGVPAGQYPTTAPVGYIDPRPWMVEEEGISVTAAD